jgi:hypothetical protein
MSSLVICGNELKQLGDTSTFQSPFSFNNHLQQPLRIPPNSEVAVQSLKIVKEGVLSVSPTSSWFQYYGVKLTDVVDIKQTTSAPIPTDLGIENNEGLSADGVAEKIAGGLNRGIPNPETFGLSTCVTRRDGDGAFDGFRHEFKERAGATTWSEIPHNWVNNYEGTGGLSFNSASNTLTALTNTDAGVFNVAVGTDYPIALNNGEYIIDVSETQGTSWAFGLTRSRALGLDPDYFNPDDSFISRNPNIFGDFIIGAFQTETNQRQLRVLHAVYDESSDNYDDQNPLTMKEVAYYDGDGDLKGGTPYNWSTNFSSGIGYTKIRINVKNEIVTADIYDPSGSGTYKKLVTSTSAKGTIFKPVMETCRTMYPMAFHSRNDNGGSARFLTIDKFSGRDIGMKYGTTDWWGYLQANDLERQYGLEVDTRPFLNVTGGVTHTYNGINASGFMENYQVVLIVEPDDSGKYPEVEEANAGDLLGFEGQSVIDTFTNTNASGLGYFDSVSVPDLKSTSALFVRLNNLNVTTYNATTSAFSKIIYAVPRFSTGTDKNIGSLFFEAPEKTYVSLNNPDELVVNSFNIDLVNENETLATDLTGKSVCILHIRQSPRM